MLVTFFLALLSITNVYGDCYMHQPRGSNNRLNEKSANRRNGNRLFDSQNNNRGGYNVGDKIDAAFQGNNPYGVESSAANNFKRQYNYVAGGAEAAEANLRGQYDMMFLAGSQKEWTWTIQHGCGNAKNMCHMVLQWTCDTHDWTSANLNNGNNGARVAYDASDRIGRHGIYTTLRNGGNTNTPNTAGKNDNENAGQVRNRVSGRYAQNKGAERGTHESEMWYLMGELRERNKGLFTADQKLNGNSQKHTRQNPGGTRRGLEIPEERDYYPWWKPSPWRDLAILTNEVEYCKQNLAPKSQNVAKKWACISSDANVNFPSAAQIQAKTQAECTAAGGKWDGFSWADNAATQADKARITAPACLQNQFSKVNHLGNVENSERGGKTATFTWDIPDIDTLKAYGCKIYDANGVVTPSATGGQTTANTQFARVVTRLRYNMSSTDYDPYKTDASQNQNKKAGVVSPIEQNPTVDVGVYAQGLRLAINTAQTGRTFQDRSHVMTIAKNKAPPAGAKPATAKIRNVNIQGKRGNIVQTFPAVEYDFWPPYVELKQGECMHFQWTGSNTHNNGNPAGDGQAGDAGEGTGGTDRGNLISTWNMRASFPMALDGKTPSNGQKDLISLSDCYDPISMQKINSGSDDLSCQISLATSGFYEGKKNMQDGGAGRQLNNLLNNAPASYARGMIVCPRADAEVGKEYFFMNTRNNNHTNRSQKMKVVIRK